MVDKLEVRDFIKQIGDPFEILGISVTQEKKLLKAAFKDQAKRYHPDKNQEQGAGERFIKIKYAYDFVSDKKKLEDYIRIQAISQKNLVDMQQASDEQKKFMNDLIKREQQFAKEKQQQEQLRKMKIKEEIDRLAKEKFDQDLKDQERQRKKLQFDLEHKDAYKKLNSIKIKWSSDKMFNKSLLNIIFKQYGPIKEIFLNEKKPKAEIEFHTSQGANDAINYNSDDLRVKFYMKQNKRDQLQEFLRTSKEKLDRDNVQVLDLSTDTLKRISHFYNKDSKIFVGNQIDLLKREEERKKMMQQMLNEELNS